MKPPLSLTSATRVRIARPRAATPFPQSSLQTLSPPPVLAGFPLHSRWTSEEYLRFLRQNSWTVRKSAVLKASFLLTYAECVKMEV